VTIIRLSVLPDPSSAGTQARPPTTRLLAVIVHPDPPDAVVFSVRGDVDILSSPFLQRVLLSQLDAATSLVTVDLTGVSFLGAAGLTVLLNVTRAMVAAESRLRLIARTHAVLLPLTVSGLAGEFDIYPALADVPSFPDDGLDG